MRLQASHTSHNHTPRSIIDFMVKIFSRYELTVHGIFNSKIWLDRNFDNILLYCQSLLPSFPHSNVKKFNVCCVCTQCPGCSGWGHSEDGGWAVQGRQAPLNSCIYTGVRNKDCEGEMTKTTGVAWQVNGRDKKDGVTCRQTF